MNKTVIYTAIFGTRDKLTEPKFINKNCDYICFTDNTSFKSKVWDIRYCEPDPKLTSLRNAKIFKILPHKYLSEYNVSLWIDGNKTQYKNIDLYLNYINDNEMVLLDYDPPSPRIKGLYSEIEHCIERKYDDIKTLQKQREFYKSENFIDDKKHIYYCAFLLRKHNTPNVIKLSEDWWNQICKFSKRDQVSILYIINKNPDLKYISIPLEITKRWFIYNQHTGIIK